MAESNEPVLSTADERRRRQEVLRNLAQRELGTLPASSPPAAPRLPSLASGRPRWLIPLGVLLVVLLIAGVVLYRLGVLPGLAVRTQPVATTVVIAP